MFTYECAYLWNLFGGLQIYEKWFLPKVLINFIHWTTHQAIWNIMFLKCDMEHGLNIVNNKHVCDRYKLTNQEIT